MTNKEFIPGYDAVIREYSHNPDPGQLDDLGYRLPPVDGLENVTEASRPKKVPPAMRIERQPLPGITPVEVAPEATVRGTIAEAKLNLREKGSPTARIEVEYIEAQRVKRHGPSQK